MNPSGLNEGYQLLLVGVSGTLGMAVAFSLCRRYYQARLQQVGQEVARLRQSLSVAHELLAQSHQPSSRLRALDAGNDDYTTQSGAALDPRRIAQAAAARH